MLSYSIVFICIKYCLHTYRRQTIYNTTVINLLVTALLETFRSKFV